MTGDEILEEVRAALQEMFEVQPERVQLDSHLIDDLGLDSIDAIDMAVRLQELTRATVQEAELKALRTVRDVVALIERMQAAKNGDGMLRAP